MKRWVYDIECMKDYFSVTFLDWDSNEYLQFEISDRNNQLKEIKNTLLDTSYLIGFNILHYDNPILGWINQQKEVTATEIYKVSQITINQDTDYDSFKPYYKYKQWKNIKSIDLFMFWSKMLRISKKLSLKFFAVSLDEEVLEMPIHYTKGNLTEDEMNLILNYNLTDCKVTKKLGEKVKEEINLRLWIKKEYGLDCLSWDAPKIASELILDSYCKKTFTEEVSDNSTFTDYKKSVRNRKYIKPFKIKLGDCLPEFKFKTKQFQDLYNNICESYNTFNKDIIIENPDKSKFKLTISIGGIHSVNNNEKYISTDTLKVYTQDIGSMYPTNIENYSYVSPELGKEMLDIYSNIKQERFQAKKQKLKTKDTFLKLCLNSFSGLIDNEYSWLYAPEQALGLRLTGQLQLCSMIEMLIANGFIVISANTDGIEVLVEDSKLSLYNNLLEQHSKEYNLIWETDEYKFIYYKNVNNYIALTNSGKIKCKGEFVYEKVLDGSNDILIVPIAVKEYFVNNIPIEDTIKNHKNIYDFCSAKKIAKNYRIVYNNETQQQLNRFFVSKKGSYLYKQKADKTTYEHVFKDGGVILLNQKTDKTPQELQVDFSYYIRKAKEVINLFEKSQLTLF
jgi:hypothetical protein